MLFAAVLVLTPASAWACSPVAAHSTGTVQVYTGTIANLEVRVGLAFEFDGAVAGRYGYANSPGTIPLSGKLEGSSLALVEHGGKGGTVSGRFLLTTEMINGSCGFTGSWSALGSDRKLAVRLELSDASFRELAYYTSPTALRVEAGAVALRQAILAGKRAEVAAAFRYPVFVQIAGKRTRIADRQDLLAHYGAIFTPAFVARIRAEVPHMMFVRDQGTMLGNGELWFDDAGQAIAINN